MSHCCISSKMNFIGFRSLEGTTQIQPQWTPKRKAKDVFVVIHFLCDPEEHVEAVGGPGVQDKEEQAANKMKTRRRPKVWKMRSRFWSQLPQDILERVLLFLPAAAQARLRVVCKEWSKLLAGPKFQEDTACTAFASYSRRPGGAGCIIMAMHHPKGPAVPKVVAAKPEWPQNVRMDLSFLPPSFEYDSESFMQMHGDDGLVCLENTKKRDTLRLCGVDMANKAWTELPPLSPFPCRASRYCVRVVASPGEDGGERRGFEVWVYWSGDRGDYCTFIMHSSAKGVWGTSCTMLGSGGYMETDPWYNGIGFGLWKSGSYIYVLNPVQYPPSLLTFSADDGRVVRSSISVHGVSFLPLLVEHSGKLLWVTWSNRRKGTSTLEIWAMSLMQSNGVYIADQDKASVMALVQLLPPNVMQDSVKVAGRPRLSKDTMFIPLVYRFQGPNLKKGPRTVGMAAYHLLNKSWKHFPCGFFQNEYHVIAG